MNNISSIAILKYFIVGLGGYLIYLLLLIGMVEGFDINPVPASFCSFIPVLIISYTLSRNWIFYSEHNYRSTFGKYIVVVGIGMTLNVMIMYITTNWLNWWYLYSQIFVVIVVPLNNYFLNYLWVFKKKNLT